MNELKSPFESLGIMGPVGSLLVIGLNYWLGGDFIGDADIQQGINVFAEAFGFVTGIWGRFKATKQISFGGSRA